MEKVQRVTQRKLSSFKDIDAILTSYMDEDATLA